MLYSTPSGIFPSNPASAGLLMHCHQTLRRDNILANLKGGNSMLHIGCHLSSAKGYLAMGRDAVSIKADTFAFFTRNPRGGKAKEIDPADVQAFANFAEEHHFTKL